MATAGMRRNDTSSQSPEKPASAAARGDPDEDAKPKLSKVKRFIDKAGLDAPTLIMMFKSALTQDPLSSHDAFRRSPKTSSADRTLLYAEAPFLLRSALRCTNPPRYPPTSRHRAISSRLSPSSRLRSCPETSSSRTSFSFSSSSAPELACLSSPSGPPSKHASIHLLRSLHPRRALRHPRRRITRLNQPSVQYGYSSTSGWQI